MMYKKVFPALLVGLIAVSTIGGVRKDYHGPTVEASGITQVESNPVTPSPSADPVLEESSLTTDSPSTATGRQVAPSTPEVSATIPSANAVAPASAEATPPVVTVETGEPVAVAWPAPNTDTLPAPAELSPQGPTTEAKEARPTPATASPEAPATELPVEVAELDTRRPTTTLASPTASRPFNGPVTIQVDATDDHELARITANIYQGSTLVKSTSTRVEGKATATHTATVSLPSGSYTIRYNAVDTAGNVSKTETLAIEVDTDAPSATVKAQSLGANGVYRKVSYKLEDAGSGQIDYITINGVKKDLTNNKWSDANDIVPGRDGAVEGTNTLVVFDTAGNSTSYTFELDTVAPKATVKPASMGANGVYRKVSYKLEDAGSGKIDYITINGVKKDLTNNKWSDANDIVPGTDGAVEGTNTLVVVDTAGNSTSYTFVLDTTGPEVTVKAETLGANGVYRTISYKLHDATTVDKVTINGQVKDLENNEWSDVNGVVPGVFGGVEGANTLVAYDALGNTTTVKFVLDTVKPTATVKSESVGANGVYRTVSYALEDAGQGQIDYIVINGHKKDLTNNKWSDANGLTTGQYNAVEGTNTLVVFDTAGNSSSYTFVLDTKGPDVSVKPESIQANGAYRNLSVKLHDAAKVDKVTINGHVKDLANNEWSDVNGIIPGMFGAVEGANVLVAYDALGNTTTLNFVLQTVAPVATLDATVGEVADVPVTTVSDAGAAEASVLEIAPPDASAPEIAVSEASVPEASVPEIAVPEIAAPEIVVPEIVVPSAPEVIATATDG